MEFKILSSIKNKLTNMIYKTDVSKLCMDFYLKYNNKKSYENKYLYDNNGECTCVKNSDLYDNNDATNYQSLFEDYEILMTNILKSKFINNKKTSYDIINSLGYGCGSWEHLWETDSEEKMSKLEIKKELLQEVFNCSFTISWTWNRILKMNWLYLRLKNRIIK